MPTVPTPAKFRGAWTSIGKDNGSRYYEYIAGKPVDGSSPIKDINYQAVAFGVLAIQRRINSYGYSPKLVEDGKLGPGTAAGIKWIQTKLGLVSDGQAGPNTSKALWRDLLMWFGGVHHVPASQLHGFIMLESGYDPGAVGTITPDRGLNQINLNAHPNITVEQAFSPPFSIDYTAKRLGDARIKYSGKTVELKNYCAIAQHNSPLQANQWYANEKPPTEQIELYVQRVLTHALNFK